LREENVTDRRALRRVHCAERADAQTDPKVKKVFGAYAALAVIGALLRVAALRHF
jgi:hypothetical protein